MRVPAAVTPWRKRLVDVQDVDRCAVAANFQQQQLVRHCLRVDVDRCTHDLILIYRFDPALKLTGLFVSGVFINRHRELENQPASSSIRFQEQRKTSYSIRFTLFGTDPSPSLTC
jgi:hypothetical protein